MAEYQYVHGVETELKKLMEFPVKVEKLVVRGALRAAAQVVKREVVLRVPVGTGRSKWKSSPLHLRDTVRVSSGVRRGVARASVRIGNRKKGVFYEAMVIRGTKPHIIKGLGRALAFGGGMRASVQHPGAKPNDFMGAANVAARDAALEMAFNYADRRLRQIIAAQGNGGK